MRDGEKKNREKFAFVPFVAERWGAKKVGATPEQIV